MVSVKEYIDLLFDKLNELVIEDISYSDYDQMTDWLGEIRKQVKGLEKKQEPMKLEIDGEFDLLCVGCGSVLDFKGYDGDYCPYCGQKLDWED